MKHYFTRFEEAVKNNWNNVALANFRGESFTFGELATQIAKFHVFFEAIGLEKGDKVALCAKNSARWGVTFFAANTYEAVLVPILADFHPESVNSLVDHSESKLLLTDSDIWSKLDITKMPSIKAVISSSDFSLLYAADEAIQAVNDNLDQLFNEKYPAGFTAADVTYPTDNDKNLAIINYTSGTTSAPKGVMLRYECVSENVAFGQKRLPSYPGDKIVSMLPMAQQTEKRIQELKEDARNAAEALEAIEKMLWLIEEFVRYKAKFVEESINDLFRVATFRLFREQANGGLEERCDVVQDGVPFLGLNNGMKVNVGIDIINALSRHYGVTVPLFVDNAEAVTRLEDCSGQVIRLVVSENDKELRTE